MNNNKFISRVQCQHILMHDFFFFLNCKQYCRTNRAIKPIENIITKSSLINYCVCALPWWSKLKVSPALLYIYIYIYIYFLCGLLCGHSKRRNRIQLNKLRPQLAALTEGSCRRFLNFVGLEWLLGSRCFCSKQLPPSLPPPSSILSLSFVLWPDFTQCNSSERNAYANWRLTKQSPPPSPLPSPLPPATNPPSRLGATQVPIEFLFLHMSKPGKEKQTANNS